MTLKQYLASISIGTLLGAVTVGVLLLLVNPEQGGLVAVLALLLSVGMTLAGVLAILGLAARLLFFRADGLVSRHVRVSFRQGLLVALVVIIALLLNHLRLLSWWNITLAIAAMATAEYFFLSSDGEKKSEEARFTENFL